MFAPYQTSNLFDGGGFFQQEMVSFFHRRQKLPKELANSKRFKCQWLLVNCALSEQLTIRLFPQILKEFHWG